MTVTTSSPAHDIARALGEYSYSSPSSYHAARLGADRLAATGFVPLDEAEPWAESIRPGGKYTVLRDGALLAFVVPDSVSSNGATPFNIIGTHTDSPGFKLKPKPTIAASGWLQAGVEVYGGPLVNSWLDRELRLAGRLVLKDGTEALTCTGPLLRIPQLAIHLDRGVGDGLKLDKQQHTAPVYGLVDHGSGHGADLVTILADAAGVVSADVAGYDIVTADSARPAFFGLDEQFLASGRLDNLSSTFTGLLALESADASATKSIAMLAAFDHEEVGSQTRSGASGPLLADVTERISTALGASRERYLRALSESICVSADAGHSVHPNYPERHDPVVRPIAGAGPLLKINANQRYATDGTGAALWRALCAAAGVPTQEFVSNNTVPCGSTIGPLTATRLGITTVDVGLPLLSMHSAREMCAVADVAALAKALAEFFRS